MERTVSSCETNSFPYCACKRAGRDETETRHFTCHKTARGTESANRAIHPENDPHGLAPVSRVMCPTGQPARAAPAPATPPRAASSAVTWPAALLSLRALRERERGESSERERGERERREREERERREVQPCTIGMVLAAHRCVWTDTGVCGRTQVCVDAHRCVWTNTGVCGLTSMKQESPIARQPPTQLSMATWSAGFGFTDISSISKSSVACGGMPLHDDAPTERSIGRRRLQ